MQGIVAPDPAKQDGLVKPAIVLPFGVKKDEVEKDT
jgi:hypothetical protein